MNLLALSLWAGNVFCDTLGQIAFKLAATAPGNRDGMRYWLDLARRPWVWVGIAAYVFEFLLWLGLLTLVPLSQGVLLASINIITIMLVGRFMFRERLTPLRLTGILLVAAGVAVAGAF